MDKLFYQMELPLVVELPTVVVMATLSMETTLGPVEVMECGVILNQHVILVSTPAQQISYM